MRVLLFKNGEIDDLFLEDCEVSLLKIGVAKYVLTVSTVNEMKYIQIWTTQKGSLEVSFQDELPAWLTVIFNNKKFEQLKSSHCSVHFENCSKNFYSLCLSRDDESVLVDLSSQGYVKARFNGKCE